MYGWILSKINELKGSETDRFLKFLALLNTFMEENKIGRIIIVGGFAAEIYSGRSYRTGDVDIIVEGKDEIIKKVLTKISEKGLRIMIPKIREISDKGIDIVGNTYQGKKLPIKMVIDDKYSVYVIPPEEVILTYLEAWKFWNSSEDKIKAVLVYCAQKEKLDLKYLDEESSKRGVQDYLSKLPDYC